MNLDSRFVFIFLTIIFPLICSAKELEICRGPKHNSLRARYTTPKGIGFKTSYSTLEGFFAPRSFCGDDWLPFLDLRGHIFNNGKWAANGGLGLRYLGCSRLWGANVFYDFRDTSYGHYNQVAAGLETLGTVFDFRINGYLPVGVKKKPPLFNDYSAFEGNVLLVHYSQYFAMKGANAELGAYIDCEKVPLYLAGGPYYLTGGGRKAWGGELRARIDLISPYFRIEGYTSYDNIFNWIGGAQLSLNIPFGGRPTICKRMGQSCSTIMTLHERAIEQVDRFEIIPQVKKHTIAPAINPATGQPWSF